MTKKIPLARPHMGRAELDAVERVIRSGQLVLGPEAERFETLLAKTCQVSHALVVSSGSAALQVALWALDIGPGDEVIVPALTFPAPAAVVAALGAKPVLADIDGCSWNISPEEAEKKITKKTRALLAVDQFGFPADYDGLTEVARRHKLLLIEDAACALGATLGGVPCGSFGRAGAFSFHPRKVVTTGEGGALTTADGELAAKARQLHNYGRRGTEFASVGLNFRLSEIQAAIGNCQLCRLEGMLNSRRALAARYRTALGRLCPEVTMQQALPHAAPTFQTFAILLPEGDAPLRSSLIEALDHEDIECSVASFSLARMAPYADQGTRPEHYPAAESLHRRGLALPLYPEMQDAQVDRVVEAFGETLRHLRKR